MGKRIVTSVRLDEDIVQMASALGLNISRISSEALKRAIIDQQSGETNVIPRGIAGVRENTRVLMAETGKFKKICELKAGDKVVSYNSLIDKCENANVIDVGPLTSSKSLTSFLILINKMGTKIEILPDTKIYCWRDSYSDADWIRAVDVKQEYHISVQSGPYRRGGLTSTTVVQAKKTVSDSLFYKLEVYPNNSFFANSNIVRKLHPISNGLPAAWGFPIKGYLGQIGVLLEKNWRA